jgi:hypothetical protein
MPPRVQMMQLHQLSNLPHPPPSIPQRKPNTDESNHKQSRTAQKLSDKRHRERINLGNEEIYGVDNAEPSSGYERQQHH